MKQQQAREIINSLSSLYPLQDYEDEALKTILLSSELVEKTEGTDDRAEIITICPNCNKEIDEELKFSFCPYCGQPITKER